MNTSTRIAAYARQNDGPMTPAQLRRMVKKDRAVQYRVDQEGKAFGRLARLRRRFDRKDRKLQRQVLKNGGALAAWQRLVRPGPRATGGARRNPQHPSRKHDTNLAVRKVFVEPGATPAWAKPLIGATRFAPGVAPRRIRRAAARVAKFEAMLWDQL